MSISQNQISDLNVPTVAAAALLGRPKEVMFCEALSTLFYYTIDALAVVDSVSVLAAQGTNAVWKKFIPDASILSYGTAYLNTGSGLATQCIFDALEPASFGLQLDGIGGVVIGNTGVYNISPHSPLVAVSQNCTLSLNATPILTYVDDSVSNSAGRNVIISATAGDVLTLTTGTAATWSNENVGSLSLDVNASRLIIQPLSYTMLLPVTTYEPLNEVAEYAVLTNFVPNEILDISTGSGSLAGTSTKVGTITTMGVIANYRLHTEVMLNGIRMDAAEIAYASAATLQLLVAIQAGDIITVKIY